MDYERRLTTLDSGLTVVLENIPHRKAAAVGITIPVGSRFETDREMGFSHFTEHLLFKGTKKRNYTEISRAIEKLGGYINAGTTRESTVYYTMLSGRHIETSLDVLSDMFHDSTFDANEFKTEKGVILEEIKMGEDDPEEAVFDQFYRDAFGDTPLGRPIAGSTKSISAAGRDDLYNYYTRHYGNKGAVLSIAGNVWQEDSADIMQKIEQYFGGNTTVLHGEPGLHKISQPAEFQSGIIHHTKKDLEQMHFIIGLPGQNVLENMNPHLMIFNNVLGGSSSSRLFRVLREENGLCYSVGSHHSAYCKEGIWLIYCACSPSQFFSALELSVTELRKALEQGLSDEEIEESKSGFAGYLELAAESPSNRAEVNARSLLYHGKLLDPDERIKRIENVDAAEILPKVRQLWAGQKPVFSSLGPLSSKKVEKEVQRLLENFIVA